MSDKQSLDRLRAELAAMKAERDAVASETLAALVAYRDHIEEHGCESWIDLGLIDRLEAVLAESHPGVRPEPPQPKALVCLMRPNEVHAFENPGDISEFCFGLVARRPTTIMLGEGRWHWHPAKPTTKPVPVASIAVAKDGDGEPCPACKATATRRIEAVRAHSRCLHCGNAWEPGL